MAGSRPSEALEALATAMLAEVLRWTEALRPLRPAGQRAQS
jgi:hypothetical protein